MAINTRALAEAIRREAQENISEATLRIRVEAILAHYLETIGVSYRAVHERRTITTGRRTDTLFGTVVIEYKRPNRLTTPAHWKEATEQLQGYLEEEATRTGLSVEHYAGILIDGQNIGFVRRRGDILVRKRIWHSNLSLRFGTLSTILLARPKCYTRNGNNCLGKFQDTRQSSYRKLRIWNSNTRLMLSMTCRVCCLPSIPTSP